LNSGGNLEGFRGTPLLGSAGKYRIVKHMSGRRKSAVAALLCRRTPQASVDPVPKEALQKD
jgi:hypothetical protein